MTRRKSDAARQSSAKADRPKTNVEDTVGRRSFLKAAALFAGGTAAGTVASPFLANPKAQAAAKTDRMYVTGRKPQAIENNQYPRTYYPGTELVGESEMRVTALGTGMPTQTPNQKAACFLVELGNGDHFLFDIGTGSTENIAGLQLDYSKLDKVFAGHLHTDHIGDLHTLWIGGWINGRYTPIHIYGPSGAVPELGTEHLVKHMQETWRWDIQGRSGTLPDAGGRLVAHEFDFSKTHVIYDENDVKITSFPAIHIMDGCVSFRLDWQGLSFVFSSDTRPNKWFIKEAKGADLVVHECFFSAEQWQRITGFTYPDALWVTNYIHTPPGAFGKVMAAVKPRHAVAYHFWNHPDILPETLEEVRKTYDGPLTLADDLTVFNVTKDHIEVREATIDHSSWPVLASAAYNKAPRSERATGLMSDFVNDGIWEGFKPPPIPQQ